MIATHPYRRAQRQSKPHVNLTKAAKAKVKGQGKATEKVRGGRTSGVDQWTEWFYYAGHCHSPFNLLSPPTTSATGNMSSSLHSGIGGADILAFWALIPASTSNLANEQLEGRWRLAVAVLDADEADSRVKSIREKLYPGSVVHFELDLLDVTSLADLPLPSSSTVTNHSGSQISNPPFQFSSRQPTAVSLDASLPPRSLIRPRQINLLVSDLQDLRAPSSRTLAGRARASEHGAAREEEGEDDEQTVPVFRLAFKYDPQPNDPDLLPVWRKRHWGKCVGKEDRRGFVMAIRKLIDELEDASLGM